MNETSEADVIHGLMQLEHGGGAELRSWKPVSVNGRSYYLPTVACALGFERAALALIARPCSTSVLTLVVAALRGLDGVVAELAWRRRELDGLDYLCPADDVQPPVLVPTWRIEDAIAACLRWRPGCARRAWVVAFARP